MPHGVGCQGKGQELVSEDTNTLARARCELSPHLLMEDGADRLPQGGMALPTLVQPPRLTRFLSSPHTLPWPLPGALRALCAWGHIFGNLSNQNIFQPNLLEVQTMVKANLFGNLTLSNPFWESVPQSSETRVFWKPPGRKILWKKTNGKGNNGFIGIVFEPLGCVSGSFLRDCPGKELRCLNQAHRSARSIHTCQAIDSCIHISKQSWIPCSLPSLGPAHSPDSSLLRTLLSSVLGAGKPTQRPALGSAAARPPALWRLVTPSCV